ncbi:hypothetical protein [Neobacillus mesonae]|uniref:hypothetical protein n=1 Tax=Neobacillus mesonae TaxID=1193713 RepID=UPI002040ECA7|nr:hypothetical protein [Neobacillus mesonae]MCM3567831.1 hypothetical protein [Neobacillus mesonae]
MERTRKERIAQAANNSKSSIKKKIAGATIAAGLLLGGTGAFAAMNPAFLSQITDFANSIFGTKNTEITSKGDSEKSSGVDSLGTFLSSLKNKIQTEVSGWGDQEKSRVSSEIKSHNDELQQQADTQATSDIANKKDALTQTANQEISDGKAALDTKFNELFPASTGQ